MCFSASVSFGSAALLIATGTATVLGNKIKPQRMIAVMPFFFGLQQIAEGIVWQTMGVEQSSLLHRFGVSLFLAFAYIVWPTWLPWSLYKIEPHVTRKKILKVIGFLGIFVSLIATYLFYRVDVGVHVSGHRLVYDIFNLERHWPPNLEALLYFTPTVIPFFISSLRTIKIAGYLVLASMLIAQQISREAATSVWCFFAALISFFIAINILWLQKGKIRQGRSKSGSQEVSGF